MDTALDDDEDGGAHSRQQRRPQRQLALSCYLHRSFLEHTLATPASHHQSGATATASLPLHSATPLFSVGRRICMTNLAFSRTTASASSRNHHSGSGFGSAAPTLHLLPTPYALPVLDPWRCDADRARLGAFAPNGLRTALGTVQLPRPSRKTREYRPVGRTICDFISNDSTCTIMHTFSFSKTRTSEIYLLSFSRVSHEITLLIS